MRRDEVSTDTRRIAARAYPFLLLGPFALTPWFPRSLNAAIVTLGGLLVGGALCLLAAVAAPSRFARGAVFACASWVALSVWFTLAATWAATPMGSLFLPHGAASFAMIAVWLTAGALVADARTLRETLGAITVAGVFFAGAAVYEALRFGARRTQGYAAGFFENSASASELLAICLVAALTGALISRDRRLRIAYAVATLLLSAGIALTTSRTAFLGLAMAGLFAVCVAKTQPHRVPSWVLAALPMAFAGLLTTLGVAAATGSLGESVRGSLGAVGTDRDAIWASAWMQIQRAPVLGKGLAQFTAFIDWGGLATGQITQHATADPHNLLLLALVGGGIVGLALLLFAFTALTKETVDVARGSRGSFGLAVTASLPVLILGMGLVGWLSEASLLAGAALLGAVLGTASSRPNAEGAAVPAVSRSAVRGGALALGVCTLALAVAFIQPISVLIEYQRSSDAGRPSLSPSDALRLYERFPLPGIATDALTALTPEVQTGSSEARRLTRLVIESAEPAASHSAPLALRSMTAALALAGSDPQGFTLFERQVLAGAEADPASGLWFALAALQAGRLGLAQKARFYATEALRFPQEADTRQLLESLVTPK